MKCTYCGHELSEGSEFCENCGMILGFNNDDNQEKNSESEIESEYTPNVFMPMDLPDEEEVSDTAAMELPVSNSEETVIVTENIPEYVSELDSEVEEVYAETAEKSEADYVESFLEDPTVKIAEGEFEAPEYTPLPDVVITVKKSSDKIRVEPVKKAKKKLEYKETYNIESIPLKEEPMAEIQKTEDTYAESGAETDSDEELAPEIIAEKDVVSQEAEKTVAAEEHTAEDVIEVIEPQEEITEGVEETEEFVSAGIFEDITSGAETPEVEEYEDITPVEIPDSEVKKGKTGSKGLAVAVIVAVICAIAVGAYSLREVIPVLNPTEESTLSGVEESTEATTEESTTEEATTEEATTEETTTEEVTTEDTTTEDVTTGEVTTQEPSTSENVVATKPAITKPTTTKPTTTKPTTTKPTTTKPTTTKPTTTKPTTTKPTTTDPYGINNVAVKKPAKYIESYTAYATAEGITLRCGPEATCERVLYLSKGADLKVLAKENGFLYVYSNRYGVYGWVSASYVSEARPQAETTTVHKGTVTPDVTTKAKTMNTTYSLNIRKGPSTKFESVQIIPTGYPVKVTGYKSGVSGWVYVTDLTYGVSGWVSSDYLK